MKKFKLIDENGKEYTVTSLEEVEQIMSEESYKDIAKKLFGGDEHFNLVGGGGAMEPTNSPTKEQLESLFLINKLANIAYYYNDKGFPNWNKTNQYKFYWYHDNGIDKLKLSNCVITKASNVYFQSPEIAEKARRIMGDEDLKKALTLNHK